ncbi:hypothetical protein FOMPIDRAFT_1136659 [Fomitopsis schrenkii]|uniref:Uncharacterized protein n=1 Tax=Fomitopsis schrenkii TaxID=2126942 RepID=S8F2Q9_FOMSC|nr:hypothetical protein FOMPIDRAFT_1136659 [Fomitopsis schrenkii]
MQCLHLCLPELSDEPGVSDEHAAQSQPETNGPKRTQTQRQQRSLASAPYSKSRASGRPGGHDPAPNGQQQVPVTLWPLCPRRGVDWVASRNQPQVAWQLMMKPHEVVRTSVANFLFTLTVHNMRDNTLLSARSILRSQEQLEEYGDENLFQLARACQGMNHHKKSFDFQFCLALMRLSFKCASLSNWADVNIAALWRNHLANEQDPPSYRNLREWYARGTKLARLAEGGSVYMLLWLAYADLRAPIVEADGNLAMDIANILRCPDPDSPVGKLVRENVIPTIAYMCEDCPIQLGHILPTAILRALHIAPDTLCCDLDTSDRLFGTLPSNSFRSLPRSADTWESVNNIIQEQPRSISTPLTPLTELSELDPSLRQPTPQPVVVSIWYQTPQAQQNSTGVTVTLVAGFDPLQLHNQRFEPPRSREENVRWTENQRRLAQAATVPTSIEELRTLLQGMYVDGVRPGESRYVRIEPSLFEDVLTIQSSRSSLLACVCKSMPRDMRQDLAERLSACFEPGALQSLDTAKSGGEHVFQALHFSWYNRHCTKGYDAPADAQPLTLRRTNRSKTNYHQLIPYPSKDMIDPRGKHSIYQSVKNILAPIFEFLDSKLQELLPETYERLDAYARILPGNEQPVGEQTLIWAKNNGKNGGKNTVGCVSYESPL